MKKLFVFAGLLLLVARTMCANPVVIGNSRFTFYSDNLVRMESALDGKFLDDPTLFAVNRTPDYRNVTVEEKGGGNYILATPAMRIEYYNDGFPFGQTNLFVYFKQNGKEKRWYIASEQRQNLKGALTTLDGISGTAPRQEGLLSRDGWFLINDTGKDVLHNGWISLRHREHIQDLYLFVYGTDYKAALKSLQLVAGSVPLTRKYIHGSWYCRWWNYTADDYRQIVDEYRQHDFPLDIIVFDMGWHTQDAKVGTGHAGNRGWTGYSWNRKLIPDPAALIDEFRKDNIYVALNEHPHDGLRPHEDAYQSFISDLYPTGKPKGVPVFDAGSKDYMSAFLKHAHGESDSIGVAFWWLDWQQDYLYPLVRGTTTKHLPWLNHLFYRNSQKNNLRGAGFSRWAGWGDHRHPIQFSGDAVGNWETLRFEVELTASSGNAGCFFWAHDIGGFYKGKDPELYTRWTQFGLLNSSLRVHSVIDKDLDRRPWLWGGEAEHAMRNSYHFRSRLMPYIYSSVHQCYTNMLPLNRGMYIEYPDEETAYHVPAQFMFGDLLLGVPVTEAGKGDDKTVEQKVWLPAGNDWYHLFTHKKYTGGNEVMIESPLQYFPLFAKGGYPLPMQPYTPRMASAPLTELVVRCYPAGGNCDNSYSLYEDDGITMDYAKGKFAITRLEYRQTAGGVAVTIYPAQGSYAGQPQKRSYRIELPGVSAKTGVAVNGKQVKPALDNELNGIVVTVPAKKISEKIAITIKTK
ncbi:MAG: DUF5110 domain-containing protein [Prevotella sp.]|jgi:alpha-glucosidase (family GH31 glycosyl hydrolase)|nr:DUF5110 domain-containing protein [Prevotella sp.]